MTQTKPLALTEEELLSIPTSTLLRLESFVKSPKLDMRELASLSRKIIIDMGRKAGIVQSVIMMQTLRQLRENELREV